MDYKKIASQLLVLLGGEKNITHYWHCITRLRLNLADNSKADIDAIKEVQCVLGVNNQEEQLQVIIGNHISQVFAHFDQLIKESRVEVEPSPTSNNTEASSKKRNPLNLFFDLISGIFTPILPAITGTGLLKGVLNLFDIINFTPKESSEYKILYAISDSVFYFIPVLIAFSAAKKFKTNEFLAVALACILLYPMADNGGALSFFGLKVPDVQYTFTVIPIILGVWLLSYISRGVDKIIPASVRVIFSPLIILIITGLITLIAIAPLGYYAGTYLAESFAWLFDVAGPIAGMVMGGTISILVITGMHYAFMPSTFANFKTLGYDFMLLPVSIVSNLAQAGAALAVAIKTRDKKLKAIAYPATLSAMLGITEPAMYGVTIKLKKPFYCALIGGAAGGTVIGLFAVKSYFFSIPGLAALPTFYAKEGHNLLYTCLAILLSFVASFTLTLFVKLDKSSDSESTEKSTSPGLASDNKVA